MRRLMKEVYERLTPEEQDDVLSYALHFIDERRKAEKAAAKDHDARPSARKEATA